MTPIALLALLLAAAAVHDFVNGFHDGANIVSTVIASRAMSARGSLVLAAAATLVGPFLLGVAVAETMGSELVSPDAVTLAVALAALIAASAWDALTWYLGIPVSASHSLVGGLLGAVIAAGGFAAIKLAGVLKVAAALFVSPLAGFLAALLVMHATRWALASATPRANRLLSRAQVATAGILALTNGANDAQKTVGVTALGLLTLGFTKSFTIPWWAIALSAVSLALGTLLGGERLIRTLGGRFYPVRPIHGFASQLASGAVILGASLAGGPVSSTQVVSMAIVGAGAAERPSKVRWGALGEIGGAWLLTVPASAILAMPVYLAIARLVHGGGA
ncbi:MAG TPA: inorganic phosphate transporter [Usitatibacter sp.]|nr:inorganic phosphate transporter [Usitatibacter sp.]